MKSGAWKENICGRENKNKKLYFLGIYTALFAVVCLIIFSWFYLTDRTFIWKSDGWKQHYKALIYYARYLRQIVKSVLLEHTLEIPNWEFAMGEGNDILSTLHYYVIGDPFAVFSVFVPTRCMYVYYDAMMIVRLYFAGIAFLALAGETEHKNWYGLLAGSMVYVFCYWNLLNVNRHPYFLNPMIYFPWLILGVEKILKGKRSYTFVLAVLFSAVSNFYFFYMLVLLTVLYVVVRLVTKYRRDIRTGMRKFWQITLGACVGASMGAVILLPICYTFLLDARKGVENAKALFYPLSYYSGLPAAFLSSNSSYWRCMGFAVPALLALFLVFRKRKKNSFLLLWLVISAIIITFPIFGQILNGFTYIANRWIWAFALLIAYMTVCMWDELMNLTFADVRYLFICLAVYFAACLLLEYSRGEQVYSSLCLAFVFLIVLMPIKNETGEWLDSRKKQRIGLILAAVSIINNAFWVYSSQGDDYASEAVEKTVVRNTISADETQIIKNIAAESGEDGFYRGSGTALTKNANMLAGVSSTQYYWSLSNSAIVNFRQAFEFSESRTFNYVGYDDRAALLSLSAVKYYVVPTEETDAVPYGFTYLQSVNLQGVTAAERLDQLKAELGVEELSEEQAQIVENALSSAYDIYVNEYALPLAYTYNRVMERENWDELSSVDKQEAMLQGVILEETVEGLETEEFSLTSENMEYSIKCNNAKVSQQENSFVVTSSDASVTFKFEGLENSETYFSIAGLEYDSAYPYDLYTNDSSVDPLNLYNDTNWEMLSSSKKESLTRQKLFRKEDISTELTLTGSNKNSKTIAFPSAYEQPYSGQKDFCVNLGYTEDQMTSITVKFSEIGTYSFDEIKIVCQPMDQYETQIEKLQENTLENVVIGTDTVTGTIQLDEPQILCFSIPYSKGWTAYVDGKEEELFLANVKNMAVYLEAGSHEIRLEYETPLLAVGAGISVLCGVLFVAWVIWEESRKVRRKAGAR